MKIHILSILLSVLLLTSKCAEQKSAAEDDDDDDTTTLTFLIQYEPEQDNDHIQIGLTIQSKDQSLKNALRKATEVATNIETIAAEFCQANPKQGFTCDDIVQVEDFEISAQYTKRRKELVFEQFIVTQEVTIKVDNTDKIGQLGDKILKTQNTKINSFDWGSNQENDDQESAIESGKQKSEDMCFHLGMKLHRIVSIEAIEQEQKEEQGGEENQEEQQQEQDGPLVYKFEVQCIPDEETARRKEQQEKLEDEQEALEKKQEQQEQEQKKQKKKKQKKQKQPPVVQKPQKKKKK